MFRWTGDQAGSILHPARPGAPGAARGVYEHQPAKLAAFEGYFTTGRGDLNLLGIPDGEVEWVDAGISGS